MSIDEERELRLRLGNALDEITPSPAPVAATLRRGKTIRTRRRVGVVAGLAAAVGIALAAPGLVHQIVRQQPIVRQQKWVLTVNPPGPHPQNGEIAWGTINGRRWQIDVTNGPTGQCVEVNVAIGACGTSATTSQDPLDPVDSQAVGDSSVTYQAWVVQPDVARVVIALADGTKLTLHPYPLYGQHWVGFAVPTDAAIASATLYSRRSELARAIPYGDTFVTWVRPGEQGLTPGTYVIGSGVVNGAAWSVVMHAGPWGYCWTMVKPSVTDLGCREALGQSAAANSGLSWAGVTGGTVISGEASPDVAYVVGTLSDGSTVRARAVDIDGPGFWSWVVPSGQRLRRVVFYTASARQVAAQSGASYNRGP